MTDINATDRFRQALEAEYGPDPARFDPVADFLAVQERHTALVAALAALVQSLTHDAHEADQDGDYCCAQTQRDDVTRLTAILRPHREAR